MNAVGLRLRAELRGRWAIWLLLAVLTGAFAGAVIGVVAGARRTDTAYGRLVRHTRAPDFVVLMDTGDPSFAKFTPAQLSNLPGVASQATFVSFASVQPANIVVAGPTVASARTTIWGRKVLQGRNPLPSRPDEATMSFTAAEKFHKRPGDLLRLTLEGPTGQPVPVTLHIVGVDATPGEFPPRSATDSDTIWVGPGFAAAHPQAGGRGLTALRLDKGMAGIPAVQSALVRLGKGRLNSAFALGWQGRGTQRSIHVQAVALWVLAGLLSLALLLVLTQLLARQSALESDGFRELHALGMTSGELWAVGMARLLAIGAVAAIVAAGVAVAVSPLFPIGLARTAEPTPGLHVDGWAILLGALATLLVIAACGAWPSWRVARLATRPSAVGRSPRRSPFAARVARTPGMPVTTVTGVAFALDAGRGREAVPVRSTIAASVIGVAALSGALVFSSSLGLLLRTPSLYGANWDAYATSNQGAGVPVAPAVTVLEGDPRVGDISIGYTGVPLSVNGTSADGIALTRVRGGSLVPRATEGRQPVGAHEVMLGVRTLTDLHLHLGSTVMVTLAGAPSRQPFTVVGAGVFPSLSDTSSLGQGTALTVGGIRRIVGAGGAPPPQTALLRLRPGVDHAAAIADLNRALGSTSLISVSAPMQPVDLVNFGRVANLPLFVGGLLGLLAAATLAHLLVTSIRRRQRDLAVLKVVGFVPSQLRRTVAWQASVIAIASLLVGVPLGIVVGRWVWLAFTRELGVIPEVSLQPGLLVLLIVVVLLVANLIALVPARTAARTPVARIFRA